MSFTFEPPRGVIDESLTIEEIDSKIFEYVSDYMEEIVSELSLTALDIFQQFTLSKLNTLIQVYYKSDVYFSLPIKYRPYALLGLITEFVNHIRNRVLFFSDNRFLDYDKYKPVMFNKDVLSVFDSGQFEAELDYVNSMSSVDNINAEDPDFLLGNYNEIIDVTKYFDPLSDNDLDLGED